MIKNTIQYSEDTLYGFLLKGHLRPPTMVTVIQRRTARLDLTDF